MTAVHGSVDPAFEPVREVVERNFADTPADGDTPADPGDLGAELVVVSGGRTVVHLWGGWKDRGRTRAWTESTMVNGYSLGKAVTATTALAAVTRGWLGLDTPVDRWWPLLGSSATLRTLLAHRGGLPAVDAELPRGASLDWSTMVDALAATPPWWEPGTAHGYHVNTFGHVVGEPLRRLAGAARFADVVAELVSRPLGLDLESGVPEDRRSEMADIDGPPAEPMGEMPFSGTTELQRMRHHAYLNPADLAGMGIVNSDGWRAAEIPSTNMGVTAAAVARMCATLLAGGELDGVRVVDRGLVDEARTPHSVGDDLVLGGPSSFGLGFMLHTEARPLGCSPSSYGHFGYGGSLCVVDPDADLAFCYVTNRPGDRWRQPRVKRLQAALLEVL